MKVFTLHQGTGPVLISMPHNGQSIPADIAAQMQPFALTVPDTDWYMDRLYDFAQGLGCSTINPEFSRYVIDLNRAPDGAVLYTGANNTELCPTSSFDLRPLYSPSSGAAPEPQTSSPGQGPDRGEVERRIALYWRPYHEALQQELARIKAAHGYAILFDAHSIQSHVPRFFDGRLPDINFGTADGQSCDVSLCDAFMAVDTGAFSKILNGRFKGGYITRQYGNPAEHIHSLQLELSQICYMNESTLDWLEIQAQQIKPVLQAIISALITHQFA